MGRVTRISQTKLAKDLGVSQGLVSMVLNGRRENISPDTYQRIWDHAISLGYKPKGMKLEQSPTETRQRQVGFVLRAGHNIHTQGSYFGHVLHGLHSALSDQGFATVFLGSEDKLTVPRLRQFFHAGHGLKGVVLLGEVNEDFLQQLRQFEPRIVAVSARHQGLCHSVLGNEPQAIASLVGHLKELGHRRIGWLGGNAGLGRHEARHHAYLAALRAAGLEADPRYTLLRKQGDRAEGVEAVHALLPLMKRRDFPTAFITYNLHMARGAVSALEREDYAVPGDLSIAAADYSSLAREEKPTITAAGCDAESLGRAAAKLLFDTRSGTDGTFMDLTLPSTLFVGQSTGPAVR
jgi:LacI family transcriptional regulator